MSMRTGEGNSCRSMQRGDPLHLPGGQNPTIMLAYAQNTSRSIYQVRATDPRRATGSGGRIPGPGTRPRCRRRRTAALPDLPHRDRLAPALQVAQRLRHGLFAELLLLALTLALLLLRMAWHAEAGQGAPFRDTTAFRSHFLPRAAR